MPVPASAPASSAARKRTASSVSGAWCVTRAALTAASMRRARRCVKPGDGRPDAGQRLGVGVRGIVRARVGIAGPLRRRERAGRGRADADAAAGARPETGALPLAVARAPGPRRRARPATRGSRRGRAPSRSCRTTRRPAGRGSHARAHRPPRARAASRARGRAGPRRPRSPPARPARRGSGGAAATGRGQPRTNSACAGVSGTVGQVRERALSRHLRFSSSSAAAPAPWRFAIQQPATRLVRPIPARQCR